MHNFSLEVLFRVSCNTIEHLSHVCTPAPPLLTDAFLSLKYLSRGKSRLLPIVLKANIVAANLKLLESR